VIAEGSKPVDAAGLVPDDAAGLPPIELGVGLLAVEHADTRMAAITVAATVRSIASLLVLHRNR
jgi:hypothetical protein